MTLSTILLLASLAGLAAGPGLYRAASGRVLALSVLDGFVFVAVGGLVLGHVLPEAAEAAGWGTLLAAALGLFGPLVLERTLHSAAEKVHAVTLVLALIGIFVHGVIDGMVLGGVTGDQAGALPLAVVVHRVPVAYTVWALLAGPYGRRTAAGTLLVVAGGTLAGWLVGPGAMSLSGAAIVGWFEALVGGSLLHVMLHRFEAAPRENPGWQWPAGIGALGGLALALMVEGPGGHGSHAAGVGEAFVGLALESAPALVVAYLLAGLVHVYLPKVGLAWLGGGRPFGQAVRGVAFGLPLPLCSCGVIPVYRSLVAGGAPATAAMAFFVATPELGLDAILLSFPLLGPQVTAARVLAAVAAALLVGWIIGRMAADAMPAATTPLDAASVPDTLWGRLKEAVRVGYGDMVDATMPWIVFGLAIAALLDPVLTAPGSIIAQTPPALEVIVFAIIGMPAYVCASGATPLVAVLIAHGVSPGAAIAFLLTGPATNVTTFGVLKDLHGPRIATAFGAAIASFAVLIGLFTNVVLPPGVTRDVPHQHIMDAGPLPTLLLGMLCLLVVLSVLRQGPRAFVGQIVSAHDDDHHEEADAGEPGRDCCSG